MPDPIRRLQSAVLDATHLLAPGQVPRRLKVCGCGGEKLFEILVPAGWPAAGGPSLVVVGPPAGPPPPAGWSFDNGRAAFDGRPIPEVTGRNLDVLRVLAATPGPVAVDDLRRAWADYPAGDGTVRWQVGQLRAALKRAFPDFEGDPVPGTGTGYELLTR